MARIGIIICGRYKACGGGKCLRAVRERAGAFARYPKDRPLEVVGWSYCGDCPGGNVESVPEEMKKNGAEAVHLATGLVVGYPPCPRIREFKAFIEAKYGLPVVVGTHPIPLKYKTVHEKLPFWGEMRLADLAPDLMGESREAMAAYD